MKIFFFQSILILFFSTSLVSQEIVYDLNFEKLNVGTQLTKRGGLKFQGWNKSEWIVKQENNNKIATSSEQQKVFLVKQFDVEAGASYSWNVDTRVVNNAAWKRKVNFSVTCGVGDNAKKIAESGTKEIKSNKWLSNKIDFVVPDNQTKVSLIIFRFAEGAKVSIDNYKLVKF